MMEILRTQRGRGAASSKKRAWLTPREQEVMSGLADGLLYKEVGVKLGIAFSTVHKHAANIYRKLGVRNRPEAIVLWLNATNGMDSHSNYPANHR